MKKILTSIFIFIAFAPFASAIDVNIDKQNLIEFNNVQFKSGRIGNCFVSHTKKEPYTRILTCKVCQQGQDPDRDGFWKDMNMPSEQWLLLDKLFYNQYGKYSPWHSNPAPIIKNANELNAIRAEKIKSIQLATAECKKHGGSSYYDKTTGACHIDMTAGMTATEKSNYAKAKDFEDDYKNYVKYKSGY